MERYQYSGIEPLENWSTEDLAELETLANAELQERSLQERSHGTMIYQPDCDCYCCRYVRGDKSDV
jgi:hypothetical protein